MISCIRWKREMASEYDDEKLNDAVSSQQLLDYELRPHLCFFVIFMIFAVKYWHEALKSPIICMILRDHLNLKSNRSILTMMKIETMTFELYCFNC